MSSGGRPRIGDEGLAQLGRRDRKAGIVIGNESLPEISVHCRQGPDAGYPHSRWQPVVQGPEYPLDAPASLRRIRRNVPDAELQERAADLRQMLVVDLAAGLAGLEVVAAPIGVKRSKQAMPRNRLPQAQAE